MNTTSDALLIAQIGNPKSFDLVFAKLVTKYERKIQAQIFKMVRNEEDAKDITQEVFIKIWNGIKNFKGESQLSTWIHRIAFNESVIHLNKNKKLKLESITDYLLDNYSAESETTPALELIFEQFEQYLEQLPQKQQFVVRTRYYEETSFEEISKNTGTSVGALKASYHFGIKKIISNFNTVC